MEKVWEIARKLHKCTSAGANARDDCTTAGSGGCNQSHIPDDEPTRLALYSDAGRLGAPSGGAGPTGGLVVTPAGWSPLVTADHFFTIRVRKKRFTVFPE